MTSTREESRSSTVKATPRAWEAITPPLSEWILDATASMGFERMTPVQANTIPLFKGNKDVVVEAVTGSGKTLAFLIPVLEKLLKLEEPLRKHHIGAIIISPTRELATQIHSVLLSLLAFHEPSAALLQPPDDHDASDTDSKNEIVSLPVSSSVLKVIPQLLVGGTVSTTQDLASFIQNSPNLIIATPGRLLELLSSTRVHCPQSSFEVLVLDEADRLLDLGFKEDLQKILQRLPKQRRTGLFSASVSEAVDQLVRVGLRNPVRISVKVKSVSGSEDKRTPSSLQMSYVVTPPNHKFAVLSRLLVGLRPIPQKAIVYLSTCAAVDYFSNLLPSILNDLKRPDAGNVIVIPLHGKHSPKIRHKNFTAFINAQPATQTMLLTTDLAARGLDIPSVDLVVQIDPPSDPKVFLHRCGRAGRAGRKGHAVVLLTPGREEDYVPLLAIRQTPVDSLVLAGDLSTNVTTEEAKRISNSLRDLVLEDRSLHEKGQRAFVSWVQSYSKHAASSIFRLQDLDWTVYAEAWGLLKMPKMPELKKTNWEGDKALGLDVAWKDYGYKDKMRETKRKQLMAEDENGSRMPHDRVAVNRVKRHKTAEDVKMLSWSAQKEHQRLKEARRMKRQTKTEVVRRAKMSEEEKAKETELARMIEQVKTMKRHEQDGEFEGFED